MGARKSIIILKAALAAAVALLGAGPARAQVVITNVATVNVTPAGFSVVAAASSAITSSTATMLSVFSDPGGVTNLAGRVGVEWYPLNSGDPTATNSYQTFLSESVLRQDSMGLGLIYARVTQCAPGTTYYYQITVTNTNGQSTVWPASGPLPSAATALQNSFVLQSQQLLVTLNDATPPGSIITLSTSNSASILAAVVGDGVPTNQVFFNVNDLIAATGGTNYSPVGSELFTATLLGSSPSSLAQTYNLIFSNNFTVGQIGAVTLGALTATVSVGTGAMLAGSSGSVPISLNSQSPLVGLSFELNVPANLFDRFTVQSSTSALSSALLSVLSSNTIQLTFTAALGQNLQGSQQIAQLNLLATANQSSAFVPLSPQALQGTNANASVMTILAVAPGRAIIIGPKPLLDMQLVNGGRDLTLYGIPGQSYQIQSSTNLSQPRGWTNFARVPMTSLAQIMPNLDPTPVAVFFRAYVLNADPPVLQASLSGTNRSLLAFGLVGTNYTLQTSSNLSATLAWYPLLSYTQTNSFQYLTNIGGTNSPVFYRLKR
jgi:hypothetical protein